MTTRQKCIAIAAALLLLLVVVSCARPKEKPNAQTPAPAVQQYEIGNGSNVIAQVAEPVEIVARIHDAGKPHPVRATIRLQPGTWLLPEQAYTMETGHVVCNEKYCEIIQ